MAVQEAYAVLAAICLSGEANYMIDPIEYKAKYNDVIIADENKFFHKRVGTLSTVYRKYNV